MKVTGNLKFDALDFGRPEGASGADHPLRSARPIVVAGSTVPGEEEIVLKALQIAREKVPNLGLVLAPRHPDRFAECPRSWRPRGSSACGAPTSSPASGRRGTSFCSTPSANSPPCSPSPPWVSWAARSCPRAGHNVLEVSASGVPVLTGPNVQNFQEIANEFHTRRRARLREGCGGTGPRDRVLRDRQGAARRGGRQGPRVDRTQSRRPGPHGRRPVRSHRAGRS